MFSSLPFPLFLLTLASYAAAQASLTPPPVSAPGDSSTGSLNPTSTPSTSNASGSGSSGVSTSGTPTSSAQFPSLSGLSDCATNCLALAIADVKCESIVDVNCYCAPKANATRFATSLVACISTQNCTDLSSAESIAEQFCGLASTSTSISFPTSVPSTSFSNPFSTSSSVSSSAGNSSATAPSSTSTSATSTSTGQGNAALPGMATEPAALLALAGAFFGLLAA
ncbi:hypothetical protein OH76DRAFT_1488028 [Lentinus brumalis]|uniref:Uncharacterized protein n=1 Tax=Lentinus brumalis TaxID=2498619 RepID=A0A371CSH3_9APHY|nr:hypothetical protein OH76DRAFT_1488028 [Polyporus brumalis]